MKLLHLLLIAFLIGSSLFGQITETGTNVGIGITNPSEKLEINGYLKVNSGSHSTIRLGQQANDAIIVDNSTASTYGGGMFFRVHDEDVSHKYRDVMMLADNANVGIGTGTPEEKLHINGSIRGNSGGGALRVQTIGGYLDLGAQNENWAHIYTDRPKIIFNKDVYTISNGFSSYNNDLILKTEGNERLRINHDTGNIGIGTKDPSEKLEINGYLKVNSGSHSTIRLGQQANDAIIVDNSTASTYGGGMFFRVHDEAVSYKYRDVMMLADNGNVGIGTRTPKNKLSVQGTIWATEVKVSLTDGADWVFEDDYNLKPLSEVESFIIANKHLPEIPSADEFRKNDMKVSEMTNKLLQKIEELTLYTIEQEKEIEAVKAEKELLKKRLDRIEALLIK